MKPIQFSDNLHIRMSEELISEIPASAYVIEVNSILIPHSRQAKLFVRDLALPDLFSEPDMVLNI